MDSWSEHQQAVRKRELNDLEHHWGEAYEIAYALGAWRAVRRDNQVSLVGASPEELRELMRLDHSAHPVPRAFDPDPDPDPDPDV